MASNQNGLTASPKIPLAVPYPSVGFLTPQMYGAKGDGVTDDTTALQAAVTAAGALGLSVYIPSTENFYSISAAIDVPAAVLIYGEGGLSFIKSTSLDSSIFVCTSKSGIQYRNLKLGYVTGSTSSALIGGIVLDTCTNCIVDTVEFDHMLWGGVYAPNTTYSTIKNCYIHDTQSTQQDSADIYLDNNASYNLLSNNYCLGGLSAEVGIFIQGGGTPPNDAVPFRNRVVGNFIGAHSGYGIAVYQVTAHDSETLICNNIIFDIDGSILAGASGNGIYIQTSGGCTICNNMVYNCCISTSSTSNGPAAISIASNTADITSLLPTIVSNNFISTGHYYGILFSATQGVVSGNVIKNSDTTTNAKGILVLNSSNTTVSANTVFMDPTVESPALTVSATQANMDGIAIIGNILYGTNGAILQVVASGFTLTNVSISSNSCSSASTLSQGIQVSECGSVSIVGNKITAVATGLFINACTNVMGSANVVKASSANSFLTGGTCSNVYFDSSNDFGIFTSTSLIQNTASGCNLEQRYTSAPGSGNWQVGDRIVNSAPSVGNPKAWTNTAAGAPGTFTSEGNL